jgi:hypothetical protein
MAKEKESSGAGCLLLLIILGYLVINGDLTFGNHDAPGVSASVSASVSAEQSYAQAVFGNNAVQQQCLVNLWNQESGWNDEAVESTYEGPGTPTYAAGIPQENPSVYGHPFSLGDWKAQIRWGKWYISEKYGNSCSAWIHEERYDWY